MSIESPCIGLCQMDPKKATCRGCFRTLDEISRWSRTTDADKADILAAVASRRQEAKPGST